jgi:hypothetical protein
MANEKARKNANDDDDLDFDDQFDRNLKEREAAYDKI